jgi:hypothetical protein
MADERSKTVDAARRRLLKIAVYAPPAILGALVLKATSNRQAAVCSPDLECAPSLCLPINSCNPNNCNPVVPCSPKVNCNPNSCNPIG